MTQMLPEYCFFPGAILNLPFPSTAGYYLRPEHQGCYGHSVVVVRYDHGTKVAKVFTITSSVTDQPDWIQARCIPLAPWSQPEVAPPKPLSQLEVVPFTNWSPLEYSGPQFRLRNPDAKMRKNSYIRLTDLVEVPAKVLRESLHFHKGLQSSLDPQSLNLLLVFYRIACKDRSPADIASEIQNHWAGPTFWSRLTAGCAIL